MSQTRRWKSIGYKQVLLVLSIAALPLIFSLAGCGEKKVSDIIDEAEQKIAEKIDDHEITLGELVCPITPDNAGDAAPEGLVLANVEVTVKNNSEVPYVADSSNFKLEDENGTLYDAVEYDGPGAMPSYETIGEGEEVTGIVVFEVPADANPVAVVEELTIGEPKRVELP